LPNRGPRKGCRRHPTRGVPCTQIRAFYQSQKKSGVMGDENDNEAPILNRVAVGISYVVLQHLIYGSFDFLIYLFAADADIFLECRRS
jgi:hypothetical protein